MTDAMADRHARKPMQLLAAGFNAWNQLALNPVGSEVEPEDVYTFTSVLEGDRIELPIAQLSHTVGTCSGPDKR